MIIRRESKLGSNDLNVVYRPCRIDEMVGNETNKAFLKNALNGNKLPHTQLFIGDAGVGKTTAARIVALGLNCERNGISAEPCLECPSCKSILNGNSMDVKEINVGQAGGKDYVDFLVKDLPMAPFNSRFKVIILDEAHELTSAAKDLLLKPLEDGFAHVYFILCTNHPEKLRSRNKNEGEAFLDRCSTLEFERVSQDTILSLLVNVCEFEGYTYRRDCLNIISEACKGVPRKALTWLNLIATEGSWDIGVVKEICDVGISEENDPQIIELSKALLSARFSEAIKIFSGIKNTPVEGVRIAVMGYFAGCLKNAKTFGDGRKFSNALDILTLPIYEQGKLAEYKWINYMYKISDIIAASVRR